VGAARSSLSLSSSCFQQLEEPFGVLPLDAMCKVIEGSVNDMVRVNHEEL
jgi:predicted membrane chloride channel (bestrophin family)